MWLGRVLSERGGGGEELRAGEMVEVGGEGFLDSL